MGGHAAEIQALKPLQWLEKDMTMGKMTPGVLTF